MFLKATLTFLAIGALSVNALTTPVARSPAPEPESQELEAWMLKRDLSYDLFSREPEDRAEWAGFARAPQNSKGKKKVTIVSGDHPEDNPRVRVPTPRPRPDPNGGSGE